MAYQPEFPPYNTSVPVNSPNPRHTVPLNIIIMNANGPYAPEPDDKRGAVPKRRRHMICDVVQKYKPALVLFQEFKWKDIRGKIWLSYPIPEQFVYSGHHEASIMHDGNLFDAQSLEIEFRAVLEDLQSKSNYTLGVTIPTSFCPLSRMCALLLTPYNKKFQKFTCISWHGEHKIVGKNQYFTYLMELMRKYHEISKIPILIAGDFNVELDDVYCLVPDSFIVHKYTPSNRREDKGVIDLFITTCDLYLKYQVPIDLEIICPGQNLNDIIDHDPIIAELTTSLSNLYLFSWF